MDLLLQQKESVKLQMEMAQKFSEESNKNYRKAFLREQLKAIQQELNENSESGSKKKDYRVEIEAAGMPDEVENVASLRLAIVVSKFIFRFNVDILFLLKLFKI